MSEVPVTAAVLPPAQGMHLQMVAEPIPWNWPVPALGMTPAEAYAFFDAMPVSLSVVTYVPSALSFSRNYAAWLELLRPDALPSVPLPPGWTRVNTVAEGLVARLAWTIPLFPSDWILSAPRAPHHRPCPPPRC